MLEQDTLWVAARTIITLLAGGFALFFLRSWISAEKKRWRQALWVSGVLFGLISLFFLLSIFDPNREAANEGPSRSQPTGTILFTEKDTYFGLKAITFVPVSSGNDARERVILPGNAEFKYEAPFLNRSGDMFAAIQIDTKGRNLIIRDMRQQNIRTLIEGCFCDSPEWSNDGDKIIASQIEDGRSRIIEIDAQSGDILGDLGPREGQVTHPSLSKSGRFLAFQLGEDIYEQNLLTNKRQPLTECPVSWGLEYAPDSDTKYAYVSNCKGKEHIVVCQNGNCKALQPARGSFLDPAWSPDGSWVAYVHSKENGHSEILVLDLLSWESTSFYQSEDIVFSLSWGPK